MCWPQYTLQSYCEFTQTFISCTYVLVTHPLIEPSMISPFGSGWNILHIYLGLLQSCHVQECNRKTHGGTRQHDYRTTVWVIS